MTGDVKWLGAAELKRQLHDGGEIVEHEAGTPWISVPDLEALH